MAIALKNRRIVTVAPETTRGTFLAPGAGDAIPMVRECTFTIEPIVVERPTLRLSLTPYAKIYPGVAKLKISMLMELTGIPGNPQTNYASPVWADLMRACGMFEVSHAGSTSSFSSYAATVGSPRIYTGFTGMSGGTNNGTPLRHGETVSVAYATTGGPIAGTVVGDTYFDDDMVVVNESSGTAGTGAITITGASSGKATNAGTVVRNANKVVAFRQRSDVNLMETVSMEVYLDGKRVQGRGMMGSFDLQMTHGDATKARFEMTGIEHSYGDQAMLTSPNEQHNVPPTFLGKDIRLSYWDGANTRVYGKDTAGALSLGAINALSIGPGNGVILRENSFDSAGFSFALITSRAGTGRFNPDEVLSGSPDNYDFINRFVAGQTFRLRAFLGSKQGDGGTFPNDGNSFDVIAPGLVFSGMADQDRDGINVWDAQFALSGGDYDATAAGELPGNDNEFTLIYR